MAPRRGIFGGGRGGNDRDFDGRPGNSEESRDYAEHFDFRNETEYTNRPTTATRIRALRIEETQREALQAAADAQRHVHFFPSVGKFIIPDENTWAAHSALVLDNTQNLYFNPEKYIYFDKIIADIYKNPALTDRNNPDWPKFRGLRTNLEVLRNDIIGIYLHDGAFNPGDEKYIPYISSIARAIGKGLANDKWYKRPFTKSLSVDVANVESVGAREIYKYLLDQQTEPGALHNLSLLIGNPDHSWGLPPLETTPYSPENMSKPLTMEVAAPVTQPEPQISRTNFVDALKAQMANPVAAKGI